MDKINETKQGIYLDYAATTPTLPQAAEVMADIYAYLYGNPSSVHAAGIAARGVIEKARENVLTLLGTGRGDDGSLFFCGSGTEAANTAIFGVARSKRMRTKSAIITTDSEHPSVDEPLRVLENEGFIIERIPTRGGVIGLHDLGDIIEKQENVILASFMLVNNETGALYKVAKAAEAVKAAHPGAVIHCDAVQGFGKMKISPAELGADIITVSAHKLGGPKGVGAMYVSKKILTAKKIIPLIYGGGQENGLRSGTENVAAIAGFGAAASHHLKIDTPANFINHTAVLRALLLESLPEGIIINTPCGDYMPHIVSMTIPGIKSEVMLRYLSARKIFVSSGSACSSRSRRISPSLLAFGLDSDTADCTIRISFSMATSEAEIKELAFALADGMKSLAKI